MTDFTCPICNETFNDDEYKVAERLGTWGYLHLDIRVKCPKCKYTPAFGRELSDSKPVYFYPGNLPVWYRTAIVNAFQKRIPDMHCPFNCEQPLELHKIWINTWKASEQQDVRGNLLKTEAPVSVKREMQFKVVNAQGAVDTYFLPSGILAQYKCQSQKCKYVRYVTL